MGDRFYEQQKKYKPKRRLKKDVIAEITELLCDKEINGLDRCTIATLDDLIDAIKFTMHEIYMDFYTRQPEEKDE